MCNIDSSKWQKRNQTLLDSLRLPSGWMAGGTGSCTVTVSAGASSCTCGGGVGSFSTCWGAGASNSVLEQLVRG